MSDLISFLVLKPLQNVELYKHQYILPRFRLLCLLALGNHGAGSAGRRVTSQVLPILFFEIRSLTGLELSNRLTSGYVPRITSTAQRLQAYITTATFLFRFWGSDSGLCVCIASTLLTELLLWVQRYFHYTTIQQLHNYTTTIQPKKNLLPCSLRMENTCHQQTVCGGLFNSLLCQVQVLALLSCYLLMSSAQSDDNP